MNKLDPRNHIDGKKVVVYLDDVKVEGEIIKREKWFLEVALNSPYAGLTQCTEEVPLAVREGVRFDGEYGDRKIYHMLSSMYKIVTEADKHRERFVVNLSNFRKLQKILHIEPEQMLAINKLTSELKELKQKLEAGDMAIVEYENEVTQRKEKVRDLNLTIEHKLYDYLYNCWGFLFELNGSSNWEVLVQFLKNEGMLVEGEEALLFKLFNKKINVERHKSLQEPDPRGYVDDEQIVMYIDGVSVEGIVVLREKNKVVVEITSPYSGLTQRTGNVMAIARGFMRFDGPRGDDRAFEMLNDMYQIASKGEKHREEVVSVLDQFRAMVASKLSADSPETTKINELALELKALKKRLKAVEITHKEYQNTMRPVKKNKSDIEFEIDRCLYDFFTTQIENILDVNFFQRSTFMQYLKKEGLLKEGEEAVVVNIVARFNYAAFLNFFAATTAASLTGFSSTISMGVQSLVLPVHRRGLRRLAAS